MNVASAARSTSTTTASRPTCGRTEVSGGWRPHALMALEINHRRGGMEGGRRLLEVGEIVCVWQGGVRPQFRP